jgi:hypothetical protein
VTAEAGDDGDATDGGVWLRHEGGRTVMSGTTAAVITIPIVVAIALFGWLAAVLYANAHPGRRHEVPLKTEVAGGAFRAVEGGRQLMPIPENTPTELPGPRTAPGSESYQVPAESKQADESQPLIGPRPR